MWTKDHTRSDANHIAWVNLIQSNTTHCAKLGLMRVHKSYIDASSAPRPLWGLFLSRFATTEGGRFMNPLHSLEVRPASHPLNTIIFIPESDAFSMLKLTKFPPQYGRGFTFCYTSHDMNRCIPHVHRARPLNGFENSPILPESRTEYVLLTT